MRQDQETVALEEIATDRRSSGRRAITGAPSTAPVRTPVDAPMLAPSHTEQLPTEFVHLYTAIESHFLKLEKPSELALNAMAEEGLSQERPYVLGVSSAVAGEGKTTTAMHLALAMAKNSY